MQLLKIIEEDSAKALEAHTNTWVQESGQVHYVVNMRCYPPTETRPKWCCYIIYKKKFDNDKAA